MAVNSVSNQKTIQQIIDQTSSKTEDRNTGELGKDDFLNLLVTQLRYQDPLQPVDDKEFIGQMAQFSALEQMQNMNSSLSQAQAYGLIGKHILATVTDESTKAAKVVEGDVTSVKMDNGKAFAVVNGTDVPIGSITEVTDIPSRSDLTNIAQYTNLIGFNVKGVVYNSQTSDVIVVNGVVKAIQRGLYEDYAVMDGVEVEISDIITETPSTDADFKEEYLNSNRGKTVDVYIVDRENDQKVPVTAVLKDFEIKDGKITAILDGLNVPVDSISRIVPVEQSNTEVEPEV